MKKSIFMALAGVMMVSSAAHAISVTGEAGEHYTNLGVGFGTESTGHVSAAALNQALGPALVFELCRVL